MKDDPQGPRVDAYKELVDRLKPPALFVELPRTGQGTDNWVLACPVDKEQVVARAIDRMFKGDRKARHLKFGEHGIWELLPLAVAVQAKNGNGPNKPQARKAGDWPASVIAVHNGLLLLGGSPEAVRRLFRPDGQLAQNADYQACTATLNRLAGKNCSARLFFRLGDLERQTLTELQTGMIKDSQFLTQIMRGLLLAGPDRPGGGIDFKKLPKPAAVAGLLKGYGGGSCDLTEDTWSLVLTLSGN